MLHPSIYFLTSFVTPGHQKFLVTNSVIFHCFLYPLTNMSWCSQITFALSFLSFGTYTFLSLSISLFSSLYSLSLNIFTPAHFISSTAFMISLFFASNPLIFSNRSTLSIISFTTCIALTSNYSFFSNVLSSLSFSTLFCQSGHLLRLLAFPILLSGTCLSMKLNLDKYNVHLACLWFNFWLLIKYSRFLWSLQISNLFCAPSSRCLHLSKHLIIANISLS